MYSNTLLKSKRLSVRNSIGLVSAVILVGFMAGGSGSLALGQQTSIRLFVPNLTFDTGPVRTPDEAVPFASKSVILTFTPGDTAVISSTPDGTGPIVIDNFLTINGVNVCAAQPMVSCFGPVTDFDYPIGVPIETVFTPIPPVDVSQFIPDGTTTVVFDLQDFGGIAGNTDLFLVTTADVTLNPTPPTTFGQAFNTMLGKSKNKILDDADAILKRAFNEQVRQPILTGLVDAGADPQVIDETGTRLDETIGNLLESTRQSLGSAFNGDTLLPAIERQLTDEIREPFQLDNIVITQFTAQIPDPKLINHQTIEDIITSGFDPSKVSLMWDNISAVVEFGREGPPPQPVAAVDLTYHGKLEGQNLSLGAGAEFTVDSGKLKGVKVEVEVSGQRNTGTGQTSGSVEVKVTVPVGGK